MYDRILKICESKGVLDTRNQELKALLLHQVCPASKECWADGLPKKDQCDRNAIQIPFIGPAFLASRSRLLVLGQNLNNDGGLFEVHELVVHAQFLIGNGVRKIRFQDTPTEYAGSLIWHRMAAYASVLLGTEWTIVGDEVMSGSAPLFDNSAVLANSLSSIAFLELIKCSTPDRPSPPYQPMWAQCPRLYLTDELTILEPRCLLVLGKDTFGAFRDALGASCKPVAEASDSTVSLYDCTHQKRNCPLVNVVHPCAHGGNRSSVLTSLAKLCREYPEHFCR